MATFKIKIKDTPTDKPTVIELRNLDKNLCIENLVDYDYYTADLFISKRYIASISWDILDDVIYVQCPIRCMHVLYTVNEYLRGNYMYHHKNAKQCNYDVEDLIENMIGIYIASHKKELTICSSKTCIADKLKEIDDSYEYLYE